MAYAIATIATTGTDQSDYRRAVLTLDCTIVASTTATDDLNIKKEIKVVLSGTENAQQINTAITSAILSEAAANGIVLLSTDIKSPKFS